MGLRLWYLVLTKVASPEHVAPLVRGRVGRLGLIAKEALKWDIIIQHDGFVCDGVHLRLTQPWFLLKKIMLSKIKQKEWQRVAERKPTVFGGLTGIHVKAHRKLLADVDPYKASVLLRLWTGAAMTKHKRAQILQESSECECVS